MARRAKGLRVRLGASGASWGSQIEIGMEIPIAGERPARAARVRPQRAERERRQRARGSKARGSKARTKAEPIGTVRTATDCLRPFGTLKFGFRTAATLCVQARPSEQLGKHRPTLRQTKRQNYYYATVCERWTTAVSERAAAQRRGTSYERLEPVAKLSAGTCCLELGRPLLLDENRHSWPG